MTDLSRPTEANLSDPVFVLSQVTTWTRRAFNNFYRQLRGERPEDAKRLRLAIGRGEATIVARVDLATDTVELRLVTAAGDQGALAALVPTPSTPMTRQ